MMKIFIIGLLLMVVIPEKPCLGSEKSEIYCKNEFSVGDYNYVKNESSGCRTILGITQNSTMIYLTYTGCKKIADNKESVSDIAQSFYEIVKKYNLKNEIKSKKTLSISLNCIVAHWPIIKYINDDTTWPLNIFGYAKLKTKNEYERQNIYYEEIRNVILQSNIYNPFIDVVNKMGCDMNLNKYFIDGLFIERNALTNVGLIKRGVFKVGEAKKEIYPSIKSGILFDLSCEDN